MKVLITSGGCKVPIDDVRHIGNFSSGRYGADLADVFMNAGHDVIFFREKGSKEPNYVFYKFGEDLEIIGINPIRKQYKDYYEYLTVKDLIKEEQPDIIISAAAISDYVVEKTEGKISSNSDEIILRLRKGEKVIKSFRELAPNAVIVGFKLLVGPDPDKKLEAIDKVFESGVDFVVYNDLLELRKGNANRELYYQSDRFAETFLINAKMTPDYLVSFICGMNKK